MSPQKPLQHILLIDQHSDALSTLAAALRSEGFKVSHSDALQHGYRLALALKPELIVLDPFLQGRDGFAICRLLRETPNVRMPQVMFVSEATTLEQRLLGYELGGVDFIAKPFATAEVLARIRIHLRHPMHPAPCPRCETEQALDTPDEELVTLNAVKRIIHADLAETYSLEALARAVGVHEQKLMKLFRRHEQSTVFAYIRQARLQYARTLLEQGKTPVEHIAALIGFNSAANFATAFKAQTGLTPRQYRRQHQNATRTTETVSG